MKIDEHKAYVGDGVYIEWDGYAYWLRAIDQRDKYCTDVICIEPEVLAAINKFVTIIENKKK